jgi:hypothetical protein
VVIDALLATPFLDVTGVDHFVYLAACGATYWPIVDESTSLMPVFVSAVPATLFDALYW